jgi:oxygen-dependent protoporphyrinogen oxidase
MRIVIVGGGITGLAAAHRLIELRQQTGHAAQITLFEASERLGGTFGTVRIGEFVVETGADSFITDKPWATDLCRRLGLEGRLVPVDERHRRALILRNGRPVPAPDGFNLLAPSRVWPLVTTPLLSPLGKLRLGLEYFVPAKPPADDESLASFVRRRFGHEVLERVVQPMVGGIYTSDPEKLSLAATLPRFIDMERQAGSLIRAARRRRREAAPADRNSSGARYGMFASLEGGMSELIDALAARVKAADELRTGRAVAGVTPAAGGHRVVAADNEELIAEGVILAAPAHRAADLIDAWAPELAGELREIEYASSAVVVTGHRRDEIDHTLDAAGLVIPLAEKRRILAVSFLSRKFPGRAPEGRVVLRTFIGGALQPELLEQSDETLTAMALAELRDILGVRGRPEFTHVARHHRAMPQYHVGHLQRVAAIERLAAQHPRLALAGNAFRGVGLPDCIHSGEEAAERVWAQLSDKPTTDH